MKTESSMSPSAGLDPERAEMWALLTAAFERIVADVEAASGRAMVNLSGAEQAARAVREPMPHAARPAAEVFERLFERIIAPSIHGASPGMLAYIQGGGLFHAALGEFIALATNRYVGYAAPAPALAELERTVIRWFCTLMGLPSTSGGVLTTGGSLANLTAIVAARNEKLGDNFSSGRLYASSQFHHSVLKAMRIAGFPAAALRSVPHDQAFRMDLTALRAMITEDRARGLSPFCVVGMAGTTNTGAVDDLKALAAVCREERLWFHVDAAYGGFFALTSRGRDCLAGLEAADSIVLDPHKSLFLPYGTGAVLARDIETFQRAHELHSDYVDEIRAEGGEADFASLSVELTRECRGLRVWLPLQLLGADAFAAALDEKLDLARHAADAISAVEELELVAAPQLSTLAFWVRAPGARLTPEARTAALLDFVNARGRVLLSSTMIRDRLAIRICALSFRVHLASIEQCLEDILTGVEATRG